MARSPLEAIRAVLAIDTLPDGRPMPAHLSHALLVLATYWPNIWPSQERLAREMHCSRRHVNRLLGELEESGMIVRLASSGRTTRYRICFSAAAAARQSLTCDVEVPEPVTPTSLEGL